VLVILPSPIPKLQHAPLPPKCFEPGSMSPTPCSSVVFTLDLHLNLSRSLRAHQHRFVKIVRHSILHSPHYLMMVVAHQNLKGHILLNLPLMHYLQLLQPMSFHPYHLLRQFLLVGLLTLLFFLNYFFIQQFLFG